MPHVQCGTCDEQIDVHPKWPLRFAKEDGKQVVLTDYSAVYEHVRDTHPDQWTDELATELEQHRLM